MSDNKPNDTLEEFLNEDLSRLTVGELQDRASWLEENGHDVPHALVRCVVVSETRVDYVCSCGTVGSATRAFVGDDVEAKARRNQKQHARNAK